LKIRHTGRKQTRGKKGKERRGHSIADGGSLTTGGSDRKKDKDS